MGERYTEKPPALATQPPTSHTLLLAVQERQSEAWVQARLQPRPATVQPALHLMQAPAELHVWQLGSVHWRPGGKREEVGAGWACLEGARQAAARAHVLLGCAQGPGGSPAHAAMAGCPTHGNRTALLTGQHLPFGARYTVEPADMATQPPRSHTSLLAAHERQSVLWVQM